MNNSLSLLSLLINFLLGASWAFALLGAASFFFIFLQVSVFYSFIGAFLGVLPGLFMVLLVEYYLLRAEQLKELKKQTSLLEELVSQS